MLQGGWLLLGKKFNLIYHVPISEGGIHYLLDTLVRKAQRSYVMIKEKLLSSTNLTFGSDEIGVKVSV